MRVEQSQQADVVRTGLAGTVKATPKTSFANVLAKTGDTNGTSGSNTSPTDKNHKADKAERPLPKGPKGETTRAVPDHPAYVEIMSGPRNGMFINVTNNERRGEAFVLVRREDRDLHIYGTGKDRRVIISWHKDQPAHQNDKTDAAKQETGGASAS